MTWSVESQAQIPRVITQITYPAYMVNRNWDIEWINEQAERFIFGRSIRKLEDFQDRHFFKLLYTGSARELVSNFEAFVKSHLPLVQGDIPQPIRNPILISVNRDYVNWLQGLWPQDAVKLPPIDYREEQVRFRQVPVESYHRIAAIFREGVLVIWIPRAVNLTPILDLLTGRQNVITDLLLHKLPTLRTMAVLVADLQGSLKISAELPPEEYFELITEIWAKLEDPFRRYGSTPGKHVGDGVVRYFLAKHDSTYHHIVQALLCAEAIRKCVGELSLAWRVKKGWLNELALNIGLHQGREWMGYIPSLPTTEFTALGDTVNIASRLSEIARDGAIWVTKELLSSLPGQILEKVKYGIRRRSEGAEHFIPRTYSRVQDLPQHCQLPKSTDIATVPVTEVIGLEVAAIQQILDSATAANFGGPFQD